MTREELLKEFDGFVAHMKRKLIEKNNDYAGKQDAMRNLRIAGPLGVATRASDKCLRLLSLDEAELAGRDRMVVDESLLDTEVDLANYAFLHSMARYDRGRRVATFAGVAIKFCPECGHRQEGLPSMCHDPMCKFNLAPRQVKS